MYEVSQALILIKGITNLILSDIHTTHIHRRSMTWLYDFGNVSVSFSYMLVNRAGVN